MLFRSGQTLISGMGELHLEVIVERMRREFNVEANVGDPRVAFRETVTAEAAASGDVDRQIGAKTHRAAVRLRIGPGERGSGIVFASRAPADQVPPELVPAVEESVRGSLEAGVLAGYPVVDAAVVLEGGENYAVDSSDLAYKIAASIGLREAMRAAKPALLEPIMAVQVVVDRKSVV